MGWEEKKVALVWRGKESVSDGERGFGIFIFYELGLDSIHTLPE